MLYFVRDILSRILHRLDMGNWGTSRWKQQFKSFGTGSEIGYPGIIKGGEYISIGNKCLILSGCRIESYEGGGKRGIRIGEHSIMSYNLTILNESEVTIGNDVLIASNVFITSMNHGIDPESELQYRVQPLTSKPVIIGDGTWIGEKACILPGVSIGKKCVIGTGSIVTKSIPDYCMAVGNPAKVVKKYSFENHKWESLSS